MTRSLIVMSLLAGCGEKVHVQVECKPAAASSLDCTVTQDKGKTEVEVCWDVAIPCKNNLSVTAPKTCTKVKDGGSTHVEIPKDKLQNLDKCEGASAISMSNLTIDGKKGE